MYFSDSLYLYLSIYLYVYICSDTLSDLVTTHSTVYKKEALYRAIFP